MSYFKPAEFYCQCGCSEQGVSERLVDMLNVARHFAGIPFVITSGYRCAEHNQAVSGSPDSAHLRGLAVDIAAVTSHERFRILYGLFKAGFERIGEGDDFFHVDIDPSKESELCWPYD